MTAAASNKVLIAVYDVATGIIKAMVRCPAEDADKQHLAWDGCSYIEVTAAGISPAAYMVDISTRALVPRVAPIAEARQVKAVALSQECEKIIIGGFEHSGRHYPSLARDQSNMTQAAIGGGKLWCSTAGEWNLLEHTQSEASAVFAAFMAHKDAARDKARELSRLASEATDLAALAAIKWSE